MANKKANRYIGITSTVALRLKLNPDIYNSQLATVLGVGNALTEGQKIISCDIKTATRDGHAKLLKVTATKNKGQANEVNRQIELICDIDNYDTATTAIIGKTIKLGQGANPVTWEITK